MSRKTIRDLVWELHGKVASGKLTEKEAVQQLLLRREGGLTPNGAKELIRHPLIMDEGRD